MSQNLYWRPSFNKGKSLSGDLKFTLRNCGKSNYRFSVSDIQFLEGLHAAGIEDAIKLINAIEKHDHIDVYEE